MKNRYILLLVISILLTLNSCLKDLLCINGNGVEKTIIRRTMPFNRIENSTSIDVIYKKADTSGVTITADENLLEYIITETDNNTLKIKTHDRNTCLDFDIKPLIIVTSPRVESVFESGSGIFIADEISGNTVELKMSGSGGLSVGNVSATDLNITLSGSGNIEINNCTGVNTDVLLSGSGNINIMGQSENSNLKISGSGEINAENLVVNLADIIISGSGNILAYVEQSLNAFISGSGNIYLKGDPVIRKTISGSGRIIKYK